MSRISIEVTAEAHQRLKAFAALRGQTLKEYILECSLPKLTGEELSEAEALRQLEQLLQPRIEAAQRGEYSDKGFDEILAEARSEQTAS